MGRMKNLARTLGWLGWLGVLAGCQSDRIDDLEERVALLESKVRPHGVDTVIQTTGTPDYEDGGLWADRPMPRISGSVLIVSDEQEPGMVSINRGSAHDVERGFTFEVFSGGMYKGKVRVVDMQEEQCFCVIEKLLDGRAILQGDSARTHR